MFDVFGKRLLQALQGNAELRLGRDHPCARAIGLAAQTGTKADIEAAQKQLSALPEDVLDTLMETAHKAMREDPAALLDLWGGRDGPSRAN